MPLFDPSSKFDRHMVHACFPLSGARATLIVLCQEMKDCGHVHDHQNDLVHANTLLATTPMKTALHMSYFPHTVSCIHYFADTFSDSVHTSPANLPIMACSAALHTVCEQIAILR